MATSETLGAIMIVTALASPLIGGAVTGLIIGLVRGHGLVGTLITAIAGGIAGYLLVLAAMLTPLDGLP
jgi:hypothetical protein